MDLLAQIDRDIIDAAKNDRPLVRDTLRLVKTTIKNAEINQGKPLAEDQILAILSKEVKQRQEAATAFKTGDRPLLAEKEEQEIAILQPYLPAQLTESEVSALIDQAIDRLGESADLGKVMSEIMPHTKGRADGGTVSRLVREKLAA